MASTQVKEILKRLNDFGVEYVVIGGVAAVILGSPRQTLDIDVCVSLAEPNISKILSALRDLHPRFRMHPMRMPLPDDPEHLKTFNNPCLECDLGIIDLLTEVSGVGKYDDAFRESSVMDVGGLTCRVLTIDALINAKRAANRLKDRLVLYELESIRDRINARQPKGE